MEAVSSADADGTPVLVVGGGSNLVVADEGFAGRVVLVRGSAPGRRGRHLRWRVRRGRRRPRLGRRRADGRRTRVDRHRGALRDPRHHRRDPDPERRRLRPGGQPDDRPGAHLGPQAAGDPHLDGPGVLVRLPHQQVQAGPVPLRRPRAPPSSSPWATSAPRSATPSSPTPSAWRSASASRRPACARRSSGCVAARGWCSTPRTTTPGAPARSSPTRSSRPTPYPSGAAAWPQADGSGTKVSAAWLIEHAGLRQGLRQRPGAALLQAHARADQPRRGHHGRPARPGPRGARRRAGALRHRAGQRAGAGRLRL